MFKNLRGRYIEVACAAIALLIAGNAIVVYWLTRPIDQYTVASAGSFGDSFGWLNPLFSGLALCGILISLRHQREEISHSMRASRSHSFENTYFQLLGLLRRNLDDIAVYEEVEEDSATKQRRVHKGVEALRYYIRQVNDRMRAHHDLTRGRHGRPYYLALLQGQSKSIAEQSRYLGTLKSILLLIRQHDEDEDKKLVYYELLSSQLTAAECIYVCYLALRGRDGDELTELLVEQGVLLERLGSAKINPSAQELFELLHGKRLNKAKSTHRFLYSQAEYGAIKAAAAKELERRRNRKRKQADYAAAWKERAGNMKEAGAGTEQGQTVQSH